MEDGPAKTFFEYLQANAEGITERLTESLNASPATMNAEDLKNRIRVTKKVPDVWCVVWVWVQVQVRVRVRMRRVRVRVRVRAVFVVCIDSSFPLIRCR